MHVVMVTLVLAFVVCVFLLVVFWLFTMTPFARHIDHSSTSTEASIRKAPHRLNAQS